MKQYDKNELAVLVPQEQRIAANGRRPSYTPLEGNSLIVLTIEESEAIFTAGFNRGVEAKTNGTGSKKKMVCSDFKTYLENKLK